MSVTTPVVSTVPAVIDELLRLLREDVFPDGDVQITDGQPIPPQDQAEDLICIGFSGQEGEPAVETTTTVEQFANAPLKESYDVYNIASSWKGQEADTKSVRDRCYEMISLIKNELAKDQTLNGKCGKARLTTDAMAQEPTSMGSVCTVRFTIHVDAFTGF